MDQIPVPDARRRSRSKTPFVLRSQCDKENCTEIDHLHIVKPAKKLPPSVQTISEKSEQTTPMVMEHEIIDTIPSTASLIQTTTQRVTRNVKLAAHDKTIEAATTTKEKMVILTESTIQSSSLSSVNLAADNISTPGDKLQEKNTTEKRKTLVSKTKIPAIIEKSTTKTKNSKTKEISQNEMNRKFEQLTSSSTPIIKHNTNLLSHNFSPIVNQRVNITKNGDLSDHIPYKEYKDAQEYWNKYPKTDYTYSKLSPYRRELAPGVVAMPNMSRPSLSHHHERVDSMARNNPSQEALIRARYQSNNYYQQKTHFRQENYYDSQDDEMDVADWEINRYDRLQKSSYGVSTINNKSLFRRIFTTISTTLYKFWYRMTSFVRQSDCELDYTRIEEEKGILRKITNSISNGFLSLFRYVYLFISSILFMDSILLKSSNAENTNKKRFLLLLIILLPLLLLAAWSLADHQQRNIFISKFVDISSGNYLPIAVSSLFATFSDFTQLLNGQFNTISSKKEDFHSSLTEQQYKQLINYIDVQIELAISDQTKTSENITMSQLKLLINDIVHENIANYHQPNGHLSDSQINQIIAIIQSELNNKKSFDQFSPQQIVQIKNIISEMISAFTENKEFQTSHINEILLLILASPKINDMIDNKLRPEAEIVNRQDVILNDLTKEIVQLKSVLADRSKENKDIGNTLATLHDQQNELNLKLSDFNAKQFKAIDSRIKRILLEIIGYSNSNDQVDLSDAAIKHWIHSVFVSKQMLEEKLTALTNGFDEKLKEEINISAGIVMKNISEQIKIEILKKFNNEIRQNQSNGKQQTVKMAGNFSEEFIRKIVKDTLAIYDADKTGLVDYALESSGGEILSTRCTENYRTKSAQVSIFGIPLWYQANTPRTVISPSVQPGQCWAFQGFPGFLVLKLNCNIFVTGFTMEHIPKSLAPKGRIDSAPKLFTVWGLVTELDPEPQQFGTYEYQENGTSLQYFRVQNNHIQIAFNIVELRIESNHGNTNYTCLYRFRVHGTSAT